MPFPGRRLSIWAFMAVLIAGCTRAQPVRVAVGVPGELPPALLHELAADKGFTVEVQPGDASEVDVLWERDPEAVLQLAQRGLIAPLPGADTYGRPASMIDPERRWVASATTARVLVYDPARVANAEAPAKMSQLSRPETARQLVLADPMHGAAAWQAAALFAARGESQALAFYRALLANGARVVADEDAVVSALLAGDRPLALTDVDRAFAAQEKQPTLVVSLPDQDPNGVGVFVLPAVLAVTTRGAANPSSRVVLDFLLSAPVTRRIAIAANSILVLTDPAELSPGLLAIGALHVMPVSYAELAARLPAVRAALAQLATPA